jgi:hypothetical protein
MSNGSRDKEFRRRESGLMSDAREEDDLERQCDRRVGEHDGDDQQPGQLRVERREDRIDVPEPSVTGARGRGLSVTWARGNEGEEWRREQTERSRTSRRRDRRGSSGGSGLGSCRGA